MLALIVAASCSLFATLWCVRELHVVLSSLNLRPRVLGRLMKERGLVCLERALGAESDVWEARLVRSVVRARSLDEALSEINIAVVDVDGRLISNSRTYAACARVAVFGCLIGVALLFTAEPSVSTSIVDVFAVGAAGVLSTLALGREARRLASRGRMEINEWIDLLIAARFQANTSRPMVSV